MRKILLIFLLSFSLIISGCGNANSDNQTLLKFEQQVNLNQDVTILQRDHRDIDLGFWVLINSNTDASIEAMHLYYLENIDGNWYILNEDGNAEILYFDLRKGTNYNSVKYQPQFNNLVKELKNGKEYRLVFEFVFDNKFANSYTLDFVY